MIQGPRRGDHTAFARSGRLVGRFVSRPSRCWVGRVSVQRKTTRNRVDSIKHIHKVNHIFHFIFIFFWVDVVWTSSRPCGCEDFLGTYHPRLGPGRLGKASSLLVETLRFPGSFLPHIPNNRGKYDSPWVKIDSCTQPSKG